MIQKFENGMTLYTGDDLLKRMESLINKRDNYDTNSCRYCIHQGNDSVCGDCSVYSGESGCSCHIHPPCSFCVDSKFEPSPYLLNYKHFKNGGKWHWECIKGEQDTFDKLTALEKRAYELTAETLTTGEISICITFMDREDVDIEICDKVNFAKSLRELIMRFNPKTDSND